MAHQSAVFKNLFHKWRDRFGFECFICILVNDFAGQQVYFQPVTSLNTVYGFDTFEDRKPMLKAFR